MKNLIRRVERLERPQQDRAQCSLDHIADYYTLHSWLQDRGYPDHLAALEAGETGPAGLEDMLLNYARYDPTRRAFERVEAALAKGESPGDADLKTLESDR